MTTPALMQGAQIESLTVDGISVRYAVAGQGPAVLLVHGLASSMITWCCNIGPLADAGFTAIAIDLPGYGDSGLPVHLDYTPDSAAIFLGAFTRQLGLHRFSIVGSSAGGLIAGLTTLKYPGQVEKVALVGSAGLGRRLSWPLRLISIPVVGELVYQPKYFGKAAVARRLFYRPPDVLDDIYPEMLRVKCLPHASHVMLRSVRSGITLMGLRPELNMLERLRHIRAPAANRMGRGRRHHPRGPGRGCAPRPARQRRPYPAPMRPLAPHGKTRTVQPDPDPFPVPARPPPGIPRAIPPDAPLETPRPTPPTGP